MVSDNRPGLRRSFAGVPIALWLLALGVAAATGACFCVPVTTGAPCDSDLNCPSGQVCTAGRCGVGTPLAQDGGSNPDGGTGCVGGCPDGSFCQGSACHALFANGSACDAGLQCLSSQCVDALCCDGPCLGGCNRCDLAGKTGICSPVDAGDPGANPSCAPYVCDGVDGGCPTRCSGTSDCVSGSACIGGRCQGLSGNGQPCSAGIECVSTWCVDGVCCNGACDAGCQNCNLAAAPGTCGREPAGSTGNSCAPYLCSGSSDNCPLRCGSDVDCISSDWCNNAVCQAKGADGQTCTSNNQCLSGTCTGGYCCGSACGACGSCTSGTCVNSGSGTPGNPPCAPFVCGASGSQCPTSCSADTNCVSSDYCSGTSCTAKLANGQSCGAADQCQSGFCAGGFCCSSACGPCGSCTGGSCTNSGAGTAGSPSCTPYLCSGTSPACPATCTADTGCIAADWCNVSGACVPKLAQGTPCTGNNQCQTNYCVGGICCNNACGPCGTCSGGLCVDNAAGSAGNPSCTPYVCSGSSPACPTTCGGSSNCAAGFNCTNNSCGLLPIGSACSSASQCQSTFCVGNVCCNNACGACGSCSSGTCTDSTAGSAGNPSCSPYLCSGTSASCPASCAGDGNCIGSDFCSANACVPKLMNGQSCGGSNQCQSGFCVSGICCNAACGACGTCGSGACMIASAGSPGNPSCAPYVCSGSSPACPGSCTSDGNCISTDYCNGVTCVARLTNGQTCAANNQCQSGNCVGGICCNSACGPCGACGSGTCQTDAAGSAGIPACAPYVCNGSTVSCPTTCSVDANCVSGDYCSGGSCVPRLGDGSSCSGGNQCQSGFCVNGICCDNACGPCGSCGTGTCTLYGAGSAGIPACAPYVCDGSTASCPASCSSDGNCVATDWCSGTTCVPKSNDGAGCSLPNQCLSGICTVFYRDADGDGFGSPLLPSLFCGSSPPGGYANNKTDCCDSDGKAHPGQLGFFTVRNQCNSWDYDCSGATELQYPGGFQGCTFPNVCANGMRYGFPCTVGAPAPGWGVPADSGFPPSPNAFVAASSAQIPGCGQTATLVNGCSTTSGVFDCGNQTYCVFSAGPTLQGCH